MTDSQPEPGRTIPFTPDDATRSLAMRLSYLPADRAAAALAKIADTRAAHALALISPASAVEILGQLSDDRRDRLVAAAPGGRGSQWLIDAEYAEGTVGRLMERPLAVFRPEARVDDTIEKLRDLTQRAHIVYGFVTDREIGRAHV